MTRDDRQKVLFVGGMPRSGSTLLDLMVGQLPGHCDIGELFYMWQAGPLRDQLCACGEPFSSCPFWQQVGQEAFGGWEHVDVADVLALQRRVDSTPRLPLALLGRAAPAHAADVRRYLDVTVRLYRAIAAVSGASVVVDSTKRPSTAYLLARSPEVDLSVALVVRDPRGVVNSWNRETPLPAGTGPREHIVRWPPHKTVRRWLTVNLMTEALGRRVPLALVRYEDLIADPVPVMHRLLELSGTPVTPEATAFLTDEGLRTGASHAAAGGRVRLRTGVMPLRLDEAWRRELPRGVRAATVGATWPLMRRYGYARPSSHWMSPRRRQG